MGGGSFWMRSYVLYSFFLLVSILVTAVGALVGEGVLYGINMWIALAVSLVLLLVFYFSKGFLKKIVFIIFCFGEGLFLAPLISYYLAEEPNILSSALIGTVVIVAIFLVIGILFKNLSGMGSYLLYALIALLVGEIINNFLFQIPWIAYISLLIFSLFISFDINRFKLEASVRALNADDVLNHVMDQYLNIVNVFVDLIRIIDDFS